MITAGVMVVIISCIGMANAEQWAEWAWDDEPNGEHDAAMNRCGLCTCFRLAFSQ
ncbi:MAG: hypothetical protein CM15mP71_6060 [Candidatus Poseidoniales archaeon]|nr:MAG: hypothetical protein CM15mP71_6060 [Candidatus Poseidoniales archaeon]